MARRPAGDQSLVVYPRVNIGANTVILDLDNNTECTLSKFAEHAELGGVTDTSNGSAAIQMDLDRLEK